MLHGLLQHHDIFYTLHRPASQPKQLVGIGSVLGQQFLIPMSIDRVQYTNGVDDPADVAMWQWPFKSLNRHQILRLFYLAVSEIVPSFYPLLTIYNQLSIYYITQDQTPL